MELRPRGVRPPRWGSLSVLGNTLNFSGPWFPTWKNVDSTRGPPQFPRGSQGCLSSQLVGPFAICLPLRGTDTLSPAEGLLVTNTRCFRNTSHTLISVSPQVKGPSLRIKEPTCLGPRQGSHPLPAFSLPPTSGQPQPPTGPLQDTR